MFANLSGAHLLVIVAVVLLLFGAPKLPVLARSLGQSLRIFRSEVSTGSERAPEVVAAVSEAERAAGERGTGDAPPAP